MSNIENWDQNLIDKYNRNGPRYTSYPTALEFSEQYEEQHFSQAISCSQNKNKALSLYIHVPFCHQLCYYCGCNKVVTRHNFKADEYLEALTKEINYRAAQFTGRVIHHLHLGGGTPTFLSNSQLQRLVNKLKETFNFAELTEMSIEIDPRKVSLLQLTHIKNLGFNRVSIGIQDFNLDVQSAINRIQDEQHIRAIVKHCRQLGIATINLDLIYGLPQQTLNNFKITLEKTININPDRISLFSYAHLPTRFPAQRKIKEDQLPDSITKLNLQKIAIKAFRQAGYQHIGMDHFAKVNDELAKAQRAGKLHRNFQGYTTGEDIDLLGLGVSSISQINQSFAQNHKTLKHYYHHIKTSGYAIAKGINISTEDIIRGQVIKQLICNLKLNKQKINNNFNINFNDYFRTELQLLQPMINDGLLAMDQTSITISRVGKPLIRSICMIFDSYQAAKDKKQFSRII